MKTRTLTILAATVAALTFPAQAQAQREPSAIIVAAPLQPIVGTFFGPSTTVDAGYGSRTYFFSMTFHSDGTADSSSTLDLESPAATAPHGQWIRTGDLKYAFTTVGGLTAAAGDPTPVGTYKINGTVTTDELGSVLKGGVTVTAYDLLGNVAFVDRAKFDSAKRVYVETE